MRLTPRVMLPPVPKTDDPKIRAYLEQLDRALQAVFQSVYVDMAQAVPSNPGAGMNRVVNVWYNPGTGLFAFQYEA